MDGLVAVAAIVAMLPAADAALATATRVDRRWLLTAAALVVVNDALLTRRYRLVLSIVLGLEWNWQGKLCAPVATLAFATLPMFGWRRSGLTTGAGARSSPRHCSGSPTPSLRSRAVRLRADGLRAHRGAVGDRSVAAAMLESIAWPVALHNFGNAIGYLV